MTQLSAAVSEKDKIMVIRKMVLNETKQLTLKVIAFNANGIWRLHYELSIQLQDLHVHVALLSERYDCPASGICGRHLHLKVAGPAKQGLPHH
jgi:hypothetical protein